MKAALGTLACCTPVALCSCLLPATYAVHKRCDRPASQSFSTCALFLDPQVRSLIEGTDPLTITQHAQWYRLPEACKVNAMLGSTLRCLIMAGNAA